MSRHDSEQDADRDMYVCGHGKSQVAKIDRYAPVTMQRSLLRHTYRHAIQARNAERRSNEGRVVRATFQQQHG